MEIATIDWKDSKFEKDELYESINAPQWIDLSVNHPPVDEDDDAWFCRPDCNHPRTVDDFFMKTVPNPTKHKRSDVPVSHTQDERNQRTALKRRGITVNKILSSTKHVQDEENQNPNFLIPTDHVKSVEETPRKLKSTFSARNLFAGNNIVNQITEFCNELKRLATRRKERVDEHGEMGIAQKEPEARVLQERDIQQKPFLKTPKVKHEDMGKSNNNCKETLRREARKENNPIADKLRVKDHEGELHTKATPSKTFRLRRRDPWT